MPRSRALVVLLLVSLTSMVARGQTLGASAPAVEQCKANVAALRHTLQHLPEAYASRKATQGDYRYLEFHGFAGIVPGVQDQECIHKGKFSVWLVGTSDALCTEDHGALNERAYQFASSFNARMAQLRKGVSLATCNGDG